VNAMRGRCEQLTTFLALYRGDSVSAAKLVALTAEPSLVGRFAEQLLGEPEVQEADPVLREMDLGRRRALRLVRGETVE
jgi:hypothetical protein